MNLPFQKHKQDLLLCRDVFHRGRTGANLTSHNIAEQMNHILLPLYKQKSTQRNEWLTGWWWYAKTFMLWACSNQTYSGSIVLPFGVDTKGSILFYKYKVIAEIRTFAPPPPHLKINPLQVCNESDEEVGVVQLLCKLSHCFGLRLLVTCSTKYLLQWSQVFGHLLRDLN